MENCIALLALKQYPGKESVFCHYLGLIQIYFEDFLSLAASASTANDFGSDLNKFYGQLNKKPFAQYYQNCSLLIQ